AVLADPRLEAVVICPSNPFISIEPILAVQGVRAALQACAAPIVAVSPIIGGRAVEGPPAKMIRGLGPQGRGLSVAPPYGDLIDGYVLDHADAASARGLAVPVTLAQTLMRTLADREALAHEVITAADAIRKP